MGHKTNLSLNDQVVKSNMDVLYNIIVQPSDYSPITLICTVFVEYSILVPLSSNDSDTSKTCHK